MHNHLISYVMGIGHISGLAFHWSFDRCIYETVLHCHRNYRANNLV